MCAEWFHLKMDNMWQIWEFVNKNLFCDDITNCPRGSVPLVRFFYLVRNKQYNMNGDK